MSEVVQVTGSPMNRQRVLLTLSCGHEAWVTSARRPRRKTHRCPLGQSCKLARKARGELK